jgi:hypothetical protein
MHDLLHRLAIALLALAAVAALAIAWASGPAAELPSAHRQWMLVALAAVLVGAVVVPALRIPAVAAALLAKVAYLAAILTQPLAGQPTGLLAWDAIQALMLAAAGAVFLHETRQEARWNGVLPLRQEGW